MLCTSQFIPDMDVIHNLLWTYQSHYLNKTIKSVIYFKPIQWPFHITYLCSACSSIARLLLGSPSFDYASGFCSLALHPSFPGLTPSIIITVMFHSNITCIMVLCHSHIMLQTLFNSEHSWGHDSHVTHDDITITLPINESIKNVISIRNLAEDFKKLCPGPTCIM